MSEQFWHVAYELYQWNTQTWEEGYHGISDTEDGIQKYVDKLKKDTRFRNVTYKAIHFPEK